MNKRLEVIEFLYQTPEPIRKIDLAKKLDTTPNYIANILAELGKKGLVFESKGLYRITKQGIKEYENDNLLTNFIWDSPLSKEITITIPAVWSESEICKNLIEDRQTVQAAPQEFLDCLAPIVLAWLIGTGHKIPTIEFNLKNEERNKELVNIFNAFMESIMEIVGNK